MKLISHLTVLLVALEVSASATSLGSCYHQINILWVTSFKKPHYRGIMWLDVLLLQASWGVYFASGSERLVRPPYEDLQPGVPERPMIVQTYGQVEKNVSSIYHQKQASKQDLKGATHWVRNQLEQLVGTGCSRDGRCYQSRIRSACHQILTVNREIILFLHYAINAKFYSL